MLIFIIPEDKSITKDNIKFFASRADWIVYKDVIIKNTEIPKVVFYKIAFDKSYFYFKNLVDNIIPTIYNKFNLIISNSDYSFPNGTYDDRCKICKANTDIPIRLNNNSNIINVFVENLDTINYPKLKPIPIGFIGFDSRDLQILNTYYNNDYFDKSIDVFCCHRNYPQSQFDDRRFVSKLCRGSWSNLVNYVESLPFNKYMGYLAKSKFCICVHGGGMDPCPKAFQALLCDTIPIIEHSALDEAFNRFPVIYVENWGEHVITAEIIEEWNKIYEDYINNTEYRKQVRKMLLADYWWDIVTGKISYNSLPIE